MLASHETSHRYAVQLGVVGFLSAVLLLWLREGLRVFWMAYWWAWLGLLAIGVLVGFTQFKVGGCTAGVEWLRGKHNWVRTYELVKVKAYSSFSGTRLSLTDRDGRRLSIGASTLREDRLLWDLVYNGMLHSVVAGGAETNGFAHLTLGLPYPSPYRADR